MKITTLPGALVLIAAAAVSLAACSSIPQKKEMSTKARVYDYPYDVVFSSVQELLHKDLKCLLKKDDRGGGEIETEWVHRVDTEGKKRWMIMANLRKSGKGTEVVFYKQYELQDDVSKSMDKYNKKKKEEPASGGWQKSEIDLTSLDSLYSQLEKKLAANP